MLGAFSAAAVIPSFETFVEEFDITITQASYFVSVPIIFLGTFVADFLSTKAGASLSWTLAHPITLNPGVFPLLWSPISKRIGRRPVLVSPFRSMTLDRSPPSRLDSFHSIWSRGRSPRSPSTKFRNLSTARQRSSLGRNAFRRRIHALIRCSHDDPSVPSVRCASLEGGRRAYERTSNLTPVADLQDFPLAAAEHRRQHRRRDILFAREGCQARSMDPSHQSWSACR